MLATVISFRSEIVEKQPLMSTTQEMVSPELFSPSTSNTPHSEIDDNSSLASSVTSANSLDKHKSDFTIPDTWRPSIMACLQAFSETQQRHLATYMY